jgi:hypothetical protein
MASAQKPCGTCWRKDRVESIHGELREFASSPPVRVPEPECFEDLRSGASVAM